MCRFYVRYTDYRRSDRGDDFPAKISSGWYYIIIILQTKRRENRIRFHRFCFLSQTRRNGKTTEIRTIIIMITIGNNFVTPVGDFIDSVTQFFLLRKNLGTYLILLIWKLKQSTKIKKSKFHSSTQTHLITYLLYTALLV